MKYASLRVFCHETRPIYLQSAVEFETGSREQSSATNCQAGVTTWVSLGYGASEAWCEGSCVRAGCVARRGRGRTTPAMTPQYAATSVQSISCHTLIINNNINTLQLTLIPNQGTPLHGARANPVLYKCHHAHPHPLMGRIRHGPQIGGYCLPLLLLLMFICMSKFWWM